jgi:diguanylate cyclase (GGDEF)-like protein
VRRSATLARRLVASLSLGVNNPELRTAQFATLSRLIPLLYFIMVANAWIATWLFYSSVSRWRTIYPLSALTLVCLLRLAIWWRKRGSVVTERAARYELARTNVAAAGMSIAFTAWCWWMLPYGNETDKVYVAFFMAITIVTSMLCLIHSRPASLSVALFAGVPFIAFFAASGDYVLVLMAANVALVLPATFLVVLLQSRDFARMVNAQTEARRQHEEQNRLLRMIDDMPAAVMTLDPGTFVINYVNEPTRRLLRNIEHLLPVAASEVPGASIDALQLGPALARDVLSDPSGFPRVSRIRLGNEVLDVQISAVTDDDGGYLGPMVTWELVTRQVEADDRIQHLARYDTMTELRNRNTFFEALDESLQHPDSPIALFIVDLDGFKAVNDTQGHLTGDSLLHQVAARLRAVCCRPGMIVGRVGGDEFTVLAPSAAQDDSERIAAELIEAVAAPYELDGGRRVRIGASVGIALAPAHATDGTTLFAYADVALYDSKAAGKNTARTYSCDMEIKAHGHVLLAAELRSALEAHDGIFVFFQPIVNIETGAVAGREALLRWHSRRHGWVPPGNFIAAAEETDLIDELDAFVLDRACRAALDWPDGEPVAINISAAQLGKGTLLPAVRRALGNSELPPSRLEVEVTETALVRSQAVALVELRQLRALGVHVALDDFGTGYSSLAHLRTFPFDKIKIDGTFVRDAVDRPTCAAVVRALVDLGNRLDLTTVAEGVETAAQLDRVRDEGCVEVQGFFCGRPEPTTTDAPLIDALGSPVDPGSASRASKHHRQAPLDGAGLADAPLT